MTLPPPSELTSLSPAEKDALLLALIRRVEELAAENAALKAENAALREKLGQPPKTPRNSSVPPSRGHKANSTTGGKSKSKSKVHPGAHRPLHPNPNRTVEVHADLCPHCRADVSRDQQKLRHSYDRIEIPEIKPDVTRVTLFGGNCPCCRKRFTAPPPFGLEPGSPFGPHLRSLVLYLHYGQAIPFARLATLLSDILGLEISEGAIANILSASAPAFEAQFSRFKAKLLSGTVLQSDETSARVGKRTWWAWVFHDGDTACFVIEPSRSKAVVEAFLGDVRPRIWVADRYGAQSGWATEAEQACLAHLLRDIEFEIQAGGTELAPKLKSLLLRAIRIGRYRSRLSDDTLRRFRDRFERRLDEILNKTSRKDHAQSLLKSITKCKNRLFVFMTNRGVPPTNNGSEQALRPAVIFRKVTNCFRSEWGAKLYAKVRSVLETGRRRGIGALRAIEITLSGRDLSAPA
jgi:transposase